MEQTSQQKLTPRIVATTSPNVSGRNDAKKKPPDCEAEENMLRGLEGISLTF